MVESFFGTLKAKLMHERDFATQAQAVMAISEYIEGFYNPRCRHSSLGYVSPLVFELQYARDRLAA